MPQNKEAFSTTVSQKGNSIRGAMLLDPKSVSFSFLQGLVNSKVRSIENTGIYMEHNDANVYVDAARMHQINRLPQQKRTRAIRQTVVNIAYSNQVLIYSEIAKDDV